MLSSRRSVVTCVRFVLICLAAPRCSARRDVLVLNVDGTPKAIMNVCLHLGGPLRREQDCLVCEWHSAAFDVRDGQRVRGPARQETRLLTLPTRIEDGVLSYVYGE